MEVLHFSGGKDSLVCLHLLRERWETLTVVWMNSGAPYPETLEQMKEIRKLVPHFLEVKADVLANINQHGWPTDILPVRNAYWGKLTTSEQGIRMQTWFDCCSQNVWLPMHRKMAELGVTTVYRGQRSSEDYKSPIRNGQTVDGIRYVFPLEDWSDEQINEYLERESIPVPAHYEHTRKSLNCWCCTGYLDEQMDQLRYLKDRHPDKFEIVSDRLAQMRDAVKRNSQPLIATEEIS